MGASAPTTVVSTPVFVVSAGRSGAATMAEALAAAEGVTIEHDYMAEHVRPLAVRRYHGLADEREAGDALEQGSGRRGL